MVVEIIQRRICDIEGCAAEAETLRLGMNDERWTIELCDEHREPVTRLPWRDERPQVAYMQGTRLGRQYDRFIRT